MANKFRGEMPFRIKEENEEEHLYTLQLKGHNICDLEEQLGYSLYHGFTDPKLRASVAFRAVVLFHALQNDAAGRKLTLKHVKSWFYGHNLTHCIKAVTELIGLTFDSAADPEDPLDGSAAPSSSETGQSSS